MGYRSSLCVLNLSCTHETYDLKKKKKVPTRYSSSEASNFNSECKCRISYLDSPSDPLVYPVPVDPQTAGTAPYIYKVKLLPVSVFLMRTLHSLTHPSSPSPSTQHIAIYFRGFGSRVKTRTDTYSSGASTPFVLLAASQVRLDRGPPSS